MIIFIKKHEVIYRQIIRVTEEYSKVVDYKV